MNRFIKLCQNRSILGLYSIKNIKSIKTYTPLLNNYFLTSFNSFSTIKKDVYSPYKYGRHRSNAEELISKIPVIEVDNDIAVCDGGSGALGHPVEYIELHTGDGKPQACKYCGLRFKMKHEH